MTHNRLTIDPVEGICILLKRFAYPCRYSDIVPHFPRPVPELCIVTNHVMNLIYNQWSLLLSDFEGRNSLTPQNPAKYAAAIYVKGAPLINCWALLMAPSALYQGLAITKGLFTMGINVSMQLNFSQLLPLVG